MAAPVDSTRAPEDKVRYQSIPQLMDCTVLKDRQKFTLLCRLQTHGKFCVSVLKRSMEVKVFNSMKVVKHRLEEGSEFTCVACHPGGNCVATGCADGKILLLFHYLDAEKAVKSQLHWHALPVLDLCFTAEGSYLLSGGHECVLVKWHQDSNYKDFLPRLGAPINHLDIVCQNFISAENLDRPLVVTEVTCAAFLDDGSWLATVEYWNDGVITPEITLKFWQFDQEKQREVLFGRHGCSQYLLSTTDKTLTVWSIITCSILWTVDLSVACLAQDPLSDIIAIFTTERQLFVFRPSNPSPVTFEQNVPKSALSMLLSHHSNKTGSKVSLDQVTRQPSNKFIREIFSSACHVQPSVSSLCQPFIRSLMVKSKSSCSQNISDDEDDDEDDKPLYHSQTVSQDSGLDSDMDMEIPENHSAESKNTDQSEDDIEMEVKAKTDIDPDSLKSGKNKTKDIEKNKNEVREQKENENELEAIFAADFLWVAKKFKT
ncbi:WDR75-like protein [Mya arenaria]|uniref:WDR75-like protein n=1 Tax=Mya arenaria TaxID=6604 RepID=A0ABY7DEF1_MYAAR|nr:WDR75-like protein [Mya arenaria]